jgi:hypothetical protein
MNKMRPEVAKRRIESFEKRFGQAHLYLAYHAAFPLSLTPDLLYRLWANFQRDIQGEVLGIPWIAVADLLLCSLFNEVGHELYEMDVAVRNELLSRLKEDEKFGQQRINELSDFLLEYVQQQLLSDDPDIQDFAQAQRWVALAYTRPNKAARELALAFSKLNEKDTAELVRMASLTETFAKPLAEFQPLLIYTRSMEHFARGNLETATDELGKALEQGNQIWVAGVNLPIPEQIKANLPPSSAISRTSTSHTKRLRQHNITLNPQFSSILGFVGVSVIAVVVGFNWWSQNQQMSKLPSVVPIHQSELNSNTPQINLKTADTQSVSAIATEKLSQGDLQVGLQAVEELLNRNSLPNAEAALDTVPQELVDNPSVYFFKGRLVWQSIQTGDNKYSVDDARRYWESAVKAQPDSILYTNALGFAYYTQGNLNRSQDSWFKALSLAVREQNRSAASAVTTFSAPVRRDALTAYAGLALSLYKTANNQPVGKREQYLNEAIKLCQMVVRYDTANFEPKELGKNWLWTEDTIRDWKALLQLKNKN